MKHAIIRGMSLRARLTCLALLFVLPLIAIVSIESRALYQSRIANVFQEAAASALIIADHPGKMVPEPERYLSTIASVLESQRGSDCDSQSRLFAPLLAAHPYFTTLLLAETDGTVMCTPEGPRPGLLADRSYFRRALATRQYTISRLVEGRVSRKRSVILSLPVTGADGRVKYVLVLGLDADWLDRTLEDAVERAGLPADAFAVVLDNEGTVVASTRNELAFNGRLVKDWKVVRPAVTGHQPFVREEIGYDGVRRATAYYRMFASPNGALHVHVGVPVEPVLHAVAWSTALHLAGILAVVLLALALALLASQRLLSQPLRRIWSAANALRQGDFSARVGAIDTGGELREVALVFDGMADQLGAERKRLEYLAMHDPLTGLSNRAALRDALSDATAMAREKSLNGPAVILLDLDGFKEINDSLGHPIGDVVLKKLALRLREAAEAWGETMTARLGGDEFVVLVPHFASTEALEQLAVAIREAVMQAVTVDEHEFYLSASSGIALSPEHGVDFATLLQSADVAMYKAKRDKKSGHCFFTPELNADAPASLRMRTLLKQALGRGELALHYQPKFDARSGMLSGAEALLRWNSAELGPVSPARFIPIAEQSAMIVEIGDWVLRTACEQLCAWQGRLPESFKMAVNLSPRQLNGRDHHLIVARLLDELELAPTQVELEITEGVFMRDPHEATTALDKLRKLGVSVAIDDFGTGYSSLSYIKHLPVDVLKIDKAFVAGLPDDEGDRSIIAAIIALASSFGFTVVAEGVETAAQAVALRELGCHQFQGYHFGRPVTASQFEAFLNPVTVDSD